MTQVVQLGTDGQAGPKVSLDALAAIVVAVSVVLMSITSMLPAGQTIELASRSAEAAATKGG